MIEYCYKINEYLPECIIFVLNKNIDYLFFKKKIKNSQNLIFRKQTYRLFRLRKYARNCNKWI
jgi:hypothetical protein